MAKRAQALELLNMPVPVTWSFVMCSLFFSFRSAQQQIDSL